MKQKISPLKRHVEYRERAEFDRESGHTRDVVSPPTGIIDLPGTLLVLKAPHVSFVALGPNRRTTR
jgi:hypothetical protein